MDIRSLFFFHCVLYQWQYNEQSANNMRNTRGNLNNNLRIPKTNTTCGQRCFTYLSPRAYNSIPNSIKHISVLSRVKVKMKQYILERSKEEICNVINPKQYYNSLFPNKHKYILEMYLSYNYVYIGSVRHI